MKANHTFILNAKKHFVAWSRNMVRTMCWAFILVLPLGYEPDTSDSTKFALGVHAGSGDIISVVRGCNGGTLHSEKSQFSDISAEGSVAISRSENSVVAIGMRTGKFSANYVPAVRTDGGYGPGEKEKVDFSYYNPHLAVEGTKVGFGAGLILGEAITSLDHRDNLDWSFHFRLGRLDEAYFLTAYGENQPLICGGGLFDVGLGYRCSRHIEGYSGLSWGMYDQMGLVQQARIALAARINWDLSFRLGGSGQDSENAFATGITLQFGKQGHTTKARDRQRLKNRARKQSSF